MLAGFNERHEAAYLHRAHTLMRYRQRAITRRTFPPVAFLFVLLPSGNLKRREVSYALGKTYAYSVQRCFETAYPSFSATFR